MITDFDLIGRDLQLYRRARFAARIHISPEYVYRDPLNSLLLDRSPRERIKTCHFGCAIRAHKMPLKNVELFDRISIKF